MENKVKVLYFVDRMLKGGIQSLVIEIAKNIDKEKFQLDFLLLDDGVTYELEDVLRQNNCNVYKLNGIWINKISDYKKYKKALNNFFKEHNDYGVIHLHSSSKNFIVLKYAKKYGIKTRIAHSHNIDFQTKNKVKKLAGDILKIPLRYYATDYFACSKLAGEWLFGKKNVENGKVKIIHNAIDYDKFKFNKEARKSIRTEFGISDDETVIGHVGRFTNQKNHTFLIDIFNEFVKLKPNSKLLLVGTGIKEEEIKEKVEHLNLSDKVIFAGFREEAYIYYNAMDVFLLPSLYEGLPLVGIEAQATGMPCFMSKGVITKEVKITENMQFISLEKSAKEWANIILNSDLTRKNTYNNLKENGYFISDMIDRLTKIYLEREETNEKNL